MGRIVGDNFVYEAPTRKTIQTELRIPLEIIKLFTIKDRCLGLGDDRGDNCWAVFNCHLLKMAHKIALSSMAFNGIS